MIEYQSKQINRRNKIRKKRRIILIGCEGNNHTEKLYFSSFNKIQKDYIIKFSCGNDTDLFHIVSNLKRAEKEIGFNFSEDRAFAIFDIDNNKNKIENFESIKNSKDCKSMMLIPSNPCFELWYLLHFIYTTKSFHTNEELIVELKKYIPNYEKSRNYFDTLFPKLNKAIRNNELLVKYVYSLNNKKFLENSFTTISEVVKILYESLKNID